MSTRRQFTISQEYARRFILAAEAGPAFGTGARQLPIWMEMSHVLGFDAGSVEPFPGHPTLFIAEPMDTGCLCTGADVLHGSPADKYRCHQPPATTIDGQPWCAAHAEIVRADNAREAAEVAAATQARRAQFAYDREVIRRIEVDARGETARVSGRSVRSLTCVECRREIKATDTVCVLEPGVGLEKPKVIHERCLIAREAAASPPWRPDRPSVSDHTREALVTMVTRALCVPPETGQLHSQWIASRVDSIVMSLINDYVGDCRNCGAVPLREAEDLTAEMPIAVRR